VALPLSSAVIVPPQCTAPVDFAAAVVPFRKGGLRDFAAADLSPSNMPLLAGLQAAEYRAVVMPHLPVPNCVFVV